MEGRHRDWVFTVNLGDDPSTWGLPDLTPMMKYLIYSEEVGETGNYHLQGFVVFNNSVSLATAKREVGGEPHMEPRRGTMTEAVAYASKTQDPTFIAGPYEFGTRPEQGARTDLMALGQRVINGESVDSILLEGSATAIRSHRALRDLRATVLRAKQPVWRDLTVTWAYGPTGYGKDRWAVADALAREKSWTQVKLSSPPQWFDGYNGQEVLILQECKGQSNYEDMLGWLDGHPLLLPVKGSFIPATYTEVVVTGLGTPDMLWPAITDKSEMNRRVTRFLHFNRPWIPIGPQFQKSQQVWLNLEDL